MICISYLVWCLNGMHICGHECMSVLMCLLRSKVEVKRLCFIFKMTFHFTVEVSLLLGDSLTRLA